MYSPNLSKIPLNQRLVKLIIIGIAGILLAIAINFQPFFQPPSTPPLNPNVSPTSTTSLPPTIPTKTSDVPTPTVVPTRHITPTPIKDYEKLSRFLSEKKWKDADEETDALMPATLECKDLKNIDELWKKNTNNRFGYSVQRKLWESQNIKKNYIDFAKSVGWLQENANGTDIDRWAFNINYLTTSPDASAKAPEGHLPFSSWQIKVLHREGFGVFMEKLSACKI